MPEMNVLKLNGTEYEIADKKARELLSALDASSSIVCTASGAAIAVADAADRPLPGLKLFGKTVQASAPSPDAPQPLSSVGSSGSVGLTVAGRNLLKTPIAVKYRDFSFADAFPVKSGTYVLSFDISNATSWRYTFMLYNADGTPVTDVHAAFSNHVSVRILPGNSEWNPIWNENHVSYNAPGNHTATEFKFVFDADYYVVFGIYYGDTTAQTVITNGQLELGEVATPYEPYKAPQTLTLSTPNGLPGIPVGTGGNYTDENGQQWICDEIDFARGAYVQRVYTETYDGSADEKWENNDGQKVWYIMTRYIHYKPIGGSPAYCTHFIRGSTAYGDTYTIGGEWGPMFYLKDYTTNEADFRSRLASSPVKLQYILETPIETPLDADTLAAFDALHTNKPATTVLNDAGAHMELSYVADTKAYIDNKFAELAAAMVNN